MITIQSALASMSTPGSGRSARWMFHGPAYQGVVELGPWSEQGILGRLRNPGAPGALLDNVGQLFGYWVMVSQPHDRLAMPVGLSALRLYGPHPPVGEELLCRVKITRCEAQEVSAERELIDERGRVWCTISGWTDRRFPTSEALWHVLQHAERYTLSSWFFTAAPAVARHSEVILYDLPGHGRSERPAGGYRLEGLGALL